MVICGYFASFGFFSHTSLCGVLVFASCPLLLPAPPPSRSVATLTQFTLTRLTTYIGAAHTHTTHSFPRSSARVLHSLSSLLKLAWCTQTSFRMAGGTFRSTGNACSSSGPSRKLTGTDSTRSLVVEAPWALASAGWRSFHVAGAILGAHGLAPCVVFAGSANVMYVMCDGLAEAPRILPRARRRIVYVAGAESFHVAGAAFSARRRRFARRAQHFGPTDVVNIGADAVSHARIFRGATSARVVSWHCVA